MVSSTLAALARQRLPGAFRQHAAPAGVALDAERLQRAAQIVIVRQLDAFEPLRIYAGKSDHLARKIPARIQPPPCRLAANARQRQPLNRFRLLRGGATEQPDKGLQAT